MKPTTLVGIGAAAIALIVLATGHCRAQTARLDPQNMAPKAPVSFKVPTAIAVTNDVVFGSGDGIPLAMNIMAPRKALKPMPAVVWIHGGGWHAGNRYSGQFECAYLAQRGFFCASIDYRLSDSYVWPAQLQDCKCAVRYLRSHAKQYGIDPNRIGVWGDSAGGHLAALMGTTRGNAAFEGDGGNRESSSAVQAVCDWYGPTDIAQMQSQGSNLNPADPLSAPALLFGTGGLTKHADAVKSADPIIYASPSSAPTLIVHGDADRTVPLAQSQLLYAALTHVGAPVRLIVLPGAGHGDDAFHSDPVMQTCTTFFERYLHSRAPESALQPVTPHAKKSTMAPQAP